jgi:hypothetical protein
VEDREKTKKAQQQLDASAMIADPEAQEMWMRRMGEVLVPLTNNRFC